MRVCTTSVDPDYTAQADADIEGVFRLVYIFKQCRVKVSQCTGNVVKP